MDPQIVAIAASAAQTLVQAMATDGWALVRDRLARLIGRGEDDATERAVQSLEQARAAAAEAGDGPVAQRWQGRLELLIEQHPELAAELAALVSELAAERGSSTTVTITSGRDTYYAGRDQTIRHTRD